MSIVDIVLAILILGGAYAGYKDGFVVSIFSLVAIVLGVLGGFKLMGHMMVILTSHYNINEKVLPYIAFGVVFLIIVIIVNLIGRLIKSSLGGTFLGPVDQAMGAILGVVRVTFMLSVILWIADSLKIKLPDVWIAKSWLHPMTADFAPKITSWLSGVFPFFSDVLQ